MSDINLVIRYENGNLKVVSKEAEKTFKKSGEKSGKSFSKSFNSALTKNIEASQGVKKVQSAFVGLGAAAAAFAGIAIFKGVEGAIRQEDAVNRLAGALKSAGSFSQDALKDFQDYASGLQEVTKIGDEVALEQLALAKSFGATNEQAKQIVTTAADLAQAFGTDLESQVRQVSKTLGGFAGELGESQKELKGLTKEQLQAGGAIDILAAKYRGQASNALNTFSGATAQAANKFGDLFEEIGNLVTQNPAVIKAVKGLTGVFDGAIGSVKEFGQSFDIFDDLLIPLTNFSEGVITYVIAPLELATNIGKLVFDTIAAGTARALSSFANFGLGVAKVLDTLGIGEQIAEDLKAFEETSESTADELALKVNESLGKLGDFSISNSLNEKNEELKTFLNEQKAIIEKETAEKSNIEVANVQKTTQAIAQDAEKRKQIQQQLGQIGLDRIQQLEEQQAQQLEVLNAARELEIVSLQEFNNRKAEVERQFTEQINAENSKRVLSSEATLKNIGSSFVEYAKTVKVTSGQVAATLQNTLARGVGNAFRSVGAALAKGENAQQAFADAAKNAVADAASALGDFYITDGVARIAKSYGADATGYQLVAAGSTMKLLAGLLGGSGSTPSGGSGSGTTAGSTSFVEPDTTEEDFAGDLETTSEPQTVLNINVEGNVVDNEAFVRNLVQEIGEEGGKQGLVFDNFATV